MLLPPVGYIHHTFTTPADTHLHGEKSINRLQKKLLFLLFLFLLILLFCWSVLFWWCSVIKSNLELYPGLLFPCTNFSARRPSLFSGGFSAVCLYGRFTRPPNRTASNTRSRTDFRGSRESSGNLWHQWISAIKVSRRALRDGLEGGSTDDVSWWETECAPTLYNVWSVNQAWNCLSFS